MRLLSLSIFVVFWGALRRTMRPFCHLSMWRPPIHTKPSPATHVDDGLVQLREDFLSCIGSLSPIACATALLVVTIRHHYNIYFCFTTLLMIVVFLARLLPDRTPLYNTESKYMQPPIHVWYMEFRPHIALHSVVPSASVVLHCPTWTDNFRIDDWSESQCPLQVPESRYFTIPTLTKTA
jgi:hypothetical protein